MSPNVCKDAHDLSLVGPQQHKVYDMFSISGEKHSCLPSSYVLVACMHKLQNKIFSIFYNTQASFFQTFYFPTYFNLFPFSPPPPPSITFCVKSVTISHTALSIPTSASCVLQNYSLLKGEKAALYQVGLTLPTSDGSRLSNSFLSAFFWLAAFSYTIEPSSSSSSIGDGSAQECFVSG